MFDRTVRDLRISVRSCESYYEHPNGFWEYKGEDGYIHLYDGENELTEGMQVARVKVYPNGEWTTETEQEHALKMDCFKRGLGLRN